MTNIDYDRVIRMINDTHQSDRAIVMWRMDCGGDFHCSTAGDPKDILKVTQQALKTFIPQTK